MDNHGIEAATEAMRRLTNEGLPEERARRVEARLRQAIARPRPTWAPWLVMGGVVTAMAVTFVALWRSPEPATTRIAYATGGVNVSLVPERPATVTTGPSDRAAIDILGRARLFVGAESNLEVVSRDDVAMTRGVVAFDVQHLRHGRRFTVRVGDDRVVVHGTRFTVWAADGRLKSVAVTEGVVAVGEDRAMLGAGALWGERLGGDPSDDMPALASPTEVADGVLLAIESTPEGAAIALDGSEVGRAPVVVRVGRGEHRTRASLPGYATQERRILVDEAADQRLLLTLDREVAPPEPSPPRRPARADDELWQTAERQLRERRCDGLATTVRRLAAANRDDEARAQGQLMIAECAVRTGATRKALAVFDAVVRDYPKATSAEAALFESGRLLADGGRRDKALARLELYLRRYPEGTFADPAAFRRCEVLVGDARPERPVACVEAYLREHPRGLRRGEAVWLLAELERATGRFAQAAEHYARAHKEAIGPDRQEQALYYQVVCAQKTGATTTRELARRYREAYPQGRFIQAIDELVE